MSINELREIIIENFFDPLTKTEVFELLAFHHYPERIGQIHGTTIPTGKDERSDARERKFEEIEIDHNS